MRIKYFLYTENTILFTENDIYMTFQDQVVKEFETTLTKYERPLDSSLCSKLPILERCIKETIRLFPIAPFIIRINNEEFQLDGKIKLYIVNKYNYII